MSSDFNIYPFGGGDFSMWKYSRFVVKTTDPRLLGQDEPYRDFWFSTAEQYVMAMKALLFDNMRVFWQVMTTRSPAEADSYAADACFPNFDQQKWHESLPTFVYEANMYKFSQDDKMYESLMKVPADALFAYTTDRDDILGTGLPQKDIRNKTPSQWRGANVLGVVLSAVRAELLQHEEEE